MRHRSSLVLACLGFLAALSVLVWPSLFPSSNDKELTTPQAESKRGDPSLFGAAGFSQETITERRSVDTGLSEEVELGEVSEAQSFARVRVLDSESRLVKNCAVRLEARVRRSPHLSITPLGGPFVLAEGSEFIRVPVSEIQAGIAALQHLAAELIAGSGPLRAEDEPPRTSLVLKALCGGASATEHVFEPEAPLAEPIVLRIEASASLRIELYGPLGLRFESPASLELLVAPAGTHLADPMAFAGGLEVRAEGIVGEHLFPFVRANVPLRIQATDDSSRWQSVTQLFQGPERNEEERVVHLRFESALPKIVGRLVDPQGVPMREAEVELCFFERTQYLHFLDLKTDAEGYFQLPLETLKQVESIVDRIQFLHDAGEDAEIAMGSSILPELPDTGVLDIGEIALSVPPRALLVAGTVRDDDGRPIPGCWITCFEHRADVPLEFWRMIAELRNLGETRSDEKGRFKFRGRPRSGFLRLHLNAPSYQVRVVTVEAGKEQIDLRLQHSETLSGRIEIESEHIAPNAVMMILLEDGRFQTAATVEENGAFTFRYDLPPASYDLCADYKGLRLAIVEGVHVPLPASDERLDPLKVDLKFRPLRLRPLDPSGSRLSFQELLLSPATGALGALRTTTDEEGIAEVLTPADIEEFDLGVSGYSTVRISWAPTVQEVKLSTARELLLHFDGLDDVPTGFRLKLFFFANAGFQVTYQDPLRSALVLRDTLELNLDPSRGIRRRFEMPGSYHLHLSIVEKADGDSGVLLDRPFTVGEEDEIRFEVSPEKLAETLRRLRER